ncbi:SMP-30/gluconolactonase/LRE family protein [Devosia ginsengisoli]|uniref:SMP-30/gluconolactonase/LRE family protein n=1 Tax=Devosia ginsengisoli TaxID=400770 RepID=A0A5B8LQN1_9HYPH|nr:SMP-30/gluconolactonase/LRE family protein [Devosia ginsengisoli]QDZ10376.1 SMP-30/gluconolactonase/LRE family protein [Devosia ginsengisoli]
MSATASLLFDSQCQLGEGPIWHQGRQQLFFFDINEQTLFAVTADGEVADSWLFNETVAAAAVLDDHMLVLATETGLKEFDLASGGMNRINEIEADNPITRTNDSRVHPSGAFWIGTMGKVDEEAPVGSVYHYRAGTLTTLKSGIRIPNATCFSPDGRIAYWTDTPTRKILQCATDPETGLPVGEWTLFADIEGHRGWPDGAVVDSEGYLWNARWGGSCVVRHAPDGSVDRVVEVPVSQVTCPAFGGADLKTLFITTAAKNLSAEQLAAEKHAGSLFAITVDVAGQPETPIAL